MSAEGDRLRDELDGAITDVLATFGDGTQMVTRWTVVVEVIDAESGKRWVWPLAAPDLMRWDVLGLLDYAHQLELAATISDQAADT